MVEEQSCSMPARSWGVEVYSKVMGESERVVGLRRWRKVEGS